MSVNKVILVGNVGKDPEVRTVGEVNVANFPLATTERGYTMSNGTQVPEKTEWHSIVVWRNLASLAEKCIHKGSKVYVEGKIKSRSYQDKNGITRYLTEIYANDIQLLDKREQEGNNTQIAMAQNIADQVAANQQPVEDLPF